MTTTTNGTIVLYRATGRYMSGSTVTGYHLVGNNGSQVKASKDRVIYMIGKGIIENMRVQSDKDGKVIIRGKGINLLQLPIKDESKDIIRTNNQAGKTVANYPVSTKSNNEASPIGQLTITKRIMQKTTCLGYMVVDTSGRELKLSRQRVLELAIQRLISNATAQKYNQPGKETVLILRGAGDCDLNKLPELIVDSSGNIIDPKNAPLKVRITRMKYGGVIYNNKNGTKIAFSSGDFLLCGLNAEISCIKAIDIGSKYTPSTDNTGAICDDYLDNLKYFELEIFGKSKIKLTAEMIKKWSTASMTDSKK